MTNYEIDWNFRYHAPTPDKIPKYEELRAAFKTLAIAIHEKCPNSRERSIALTNLETAMFWANASVARHPEQPPQANRA